MRFGVPRGGRAEKRNIRVSLMVIFYSISSHGRPTIHSDIVGRCQLEYLLMDISGFYFG